MSHPHQKLCLEVSAPLAHSQRPDSTAQTCAAAAGDAPTMSTPLLFLFLARMKLSRTTIRGLVDERI